MFSLSIWDIKTFILILSYKTQFLTFVFVENVITRHVLFFLFLFLFLSRFLLLFLFLVSFTLCVKKKLQKFWKTKEVSVWSLNTKLRKLEAFFWQKIRVQEKKKWKESVLVVLAQNLFYNWCPFYTNLSSEILIEN